MKAMVLLLVAAVVALGAATETVEARRLGGGMSLGKQRSAPPPPPPTATARAAPAATAAASGSTAQRWVGPLAGLVAGGLVASLLFGGGFQGLAPGDLMLFLALGIGLVVLIRLRRGDGAAAHRSPVGALAGGAGSERPATKAPVCPPPPPRRSTALDRS